MRSRRDDGGLSLVQVLQVGAVVLASGALLFFYVWWPIQAERAKGQMKALEKQLSEEKTVLNNLQGKIHHATSLPALDQWAKAHGTWKSPGANDVLFIEN